MKDRPQTRRSETHPLFTSPLAVATVLKTPLNLPRLQVGEAIEEANGGAETKVEGDLGVGEGEVDVAIRMGDFSTDRSTLFECI